MMYQINKFVPYRIKPTNKQSFFSRHSFVIFFGLLAIAVIFTLSASASARSLVPSSLLSFLKTGDYFYSGFGGMPNFFSDKMKLAEENRELLKEVEKSRINAAEFEALKYENEKLREELKIKPKGEFLASNILAKSPQIPLDTLFINRGAQDGIKEGDFVFAGDRTLIGKVVKVFENNSTAALNSFAGIVSFGFVARTGEPIEIKGEGGGAIEAKVPIDFDINKGDEIMVNGSGSYLAAIVGIIEEDESSGFKNVMMSLPVNASKVNTVFTEHFIGQ